MCKLNDLRVKHLTLEKVICTISTKLGMVDILNGERREGKIKTRMLGKDRGNNEGKKKKKMGQLVNKWGGVEGRGQSYWMN